MLIWIKSLDVMVSLDPGTGSNLTAEDVDNGMVDYVDYAVISRATDEDQSDECMPLFDGGILMSKDKLNADSALELVYTNLVPGPYNKDDIEVLNEVY